MNQAVLNILIVIGVIVAAAAILKARGLLKFKELKDEFDVNYCEYRIFGGPDGKDLELIMKRAPDFSAQLSVRGKESADGRDIYESYMLPIEVFNEFRDMYVAYQVESWGNLPYSDEEPENEPTVMVKFETPYVRTTLYSNMVFPEGKKKILEDTYELLNQYREHKHISEQ
ncbi:MAG: hypothetical protein IKD89_00970 [Clostridia bacterium]|nr:hypothetical protein [Clostridia bacterium]